MADESLERIRNASKKIEDLTAQIPGAIDAEKRRIEEASRARLDRQKAELEERIKHSPEIVDEERDIEFKPDGSIVPESIRRVILKWDDGYENTIFTSGFFESDELQKLSRQIGSQKDAFDSLSDQEKAKIQADFHSTKGKAESSKPYSDYLHSEALGRRFQELKENPPMPFARKP